MIAVMRVSMPMAQFVTWVAVAFAIGIAVGAALALKSRRR